MGRGPNVPKLWFERLNDRLNLSLLTGSIVFGWLPFLVLSIPYALYVPVSQFLLIVQTMAVILTITYLMLTGSYARRRIEGLASYTSSLMGGSPAWDLARLYGLLPAFGVSALTILGLFPVFYRPGLLGFFSNLPYFYFLFVNSTFVWVILYSTYAIYKIGSLPLSLKSFAEDRFLGLRSFGNTSLMLAGMYLAYVTGFFVPILLPMGTIAALGLLIALFLVGLVIFVLPQVSVRRKLVRAKRDELNWIGPRYADLVRVLKVRDGERLNTSLHDELEIIDKLQRDIREIHTWPFDLGVFARLSAVVLTVVAIILGRILQLALHLAT